MKANSVHFILKGKSSYKNLAPVFPEILTTFLQDIGQVPEEEELLQMLIELNVIDLEEDRKPEGYNRKGKARLIFPLDRKEFYIITYSKYDLKPIKEKINDILKGANIKFDVKENDNIDFD